jgi:hypothetical protein
MKSVKARVQTEDGLSVEVESDTLDYEEALASTLRAVRRTTPGAPATASPTSGSLRRLVEKLAPETIHYLRLLVEHPEGLSDEEIRKRLGLESRQKLAGMKGSITKAAEHVGLTGGDIIERDVGRDQQGRTYHFAIPDAVRQSLADVLPEEPAQEPVSAAPSPPEPDDVPF